MKYFIELTLIANEDFSVYKLWSKVYMQLHLAFVETKDANNKINLGISFPEYKFNQEKGVGFLGTKLRLLAEAEEELKKMEIKHWLESLTNYVHISSIQEVPIHKINEYAIYSRKQVKTNVDRLARHRIKRGDISFEEAKTRYQNIITTTDLPFIQLKSLTSDKLFKLFIEKKICDKSMESKFSTYGLSNVCTVPEF